MNAQTHPSAYTVVARKCPLTRRRLETVRWLSLDKRVKDIAEIMGVKTTTVNDHILTSKAILGLDTTTALVGTALRNGWIK